MSERANYFTLGLFVIVAVTLLMVGSIMLGAASFLRKVTYAETYFTESVNGLERGTSVKFRGVTVGRVSHVGFASHKYPMGDEALLADQGRVLVEMAFDKSAGLRVEPDLAWINKLIEAGLRVRPAQSGLVGGIYLELLFVDSAGQTPSLAPKWKPQYPYIPATESQMEVITSAAERIAKQLEDARIDQVIQKIASLVSNLDQRVQEVDVKALGESAAATLEEIRKASSRAGQVLSSPDLEAALKDMPEITAKMRSSAARIDELIAQAEKQDLVSNVSGGAANARAAAADVRLLARRLEIIVAEQQADLERIVGSLRRTLGNASDLSEDAKQNPSRLLFGSPPPRTGPLDEGNAR